MKKILKKLCFWDAPAHGALFGTILFLLGCWSLFVYPLFLSEKFPEIFDKYEVSLWYVSGILIIIFMIYLLICGIHFGVLYKKELTFARRWKWQIPATCCWLLLGFAVFVILKKLEAPDFITESTMIFVRFTIFITIFAGIIFCAKIIETTSAIPYHKLFGKGAFTVLILFTLYCAAISIFCITAC